ncbi:hypothetical protein EG328_008220 [Venturia inaequalis]|uniref:Antigenic cell wall galactomannoprotein n=1 Tax=Venturia inaequalis TaxID=5025 RepID=A0A8H3Z494_VENIN|nr:hypothetical protein EG328_008220 [Venturia inaequalis]
MRFSIFASLALVGTSLAAPSSSLQKRQEISNVDFVLDGYKGILKNSEQLITKITSMKSGDDVAAVLKEMSTLTADSTKITEKMIADINKTPGKMTVAAAFSVAKPSGDVAISTVTIIDDLVLKKDLFVKANVHTIVLEDLNKLYEESSKFVTAAKSKIPDQFVAAASPRFQQLLDSLKKGIDAFKV